MRTTQSGSGKVIVAGAGPAGSSLAIRLATAGREVCVIERSRFPRHKLCGEFISPECLAHFSELGVLSSIGAAGGDPIRETVFYALNGNSAVVRSEWFHGSGGAALGLSRAEMDHRLLEAARHAGAAVIEGASVCGAHLEGGRVAAVEVRFEDGRRETVEGSIFVDATGRQRVLAKYASADRSKKRRRPPSLVGFKAHFSDVGMQPGRCEIYFFRGGYGGLSFVEGGRANHCFLVSSKAARECGGDADSILSNLVFRNARARETLGAAKRQMEWLAVAVEGFGPSDLNPAPNLFAVGDAGAFIDPFTGSGMLMALESTELLAETLLSDSAETAAIRYSSAHRRRFKGRLRLCAVMRRLAFDPHLASAAVSAAGFSSGFRRMIAVMTRKGVPEKVAGP
ncbi:MAG: NAD(P)/FAD-dependent oxidoreductase [Acidobacteriota bacterium]|nr:MAG: NAD(P)/FAD-dependent oxidoreductase [Acidobacteriota bacterium]